MDERLACLTSPRDSSRSSPLQTETSAGAASGGKSQGMLPSQAHPRVLSRPSQRVPPLLPSARELPLLGAPAARGCASTATERDERLQRS